MKSLHLLKAKSGEAIEHHFILEMQKLYEPPYEDRIMYYTAKMITDQGVRG